MKTFHLIAISLWLVIGNAYSQENNVDYWIALAESRVADNSLITPEGESALDAYNKALELTQDKSRIARQIESLKLRVIEQSSLIAERISYPAAIQYLAKAEKLMPNSPEITLEKQKLIDRHEFLNVEQRYLERHRTFRDRD